MTELLVHTDSYLKEFQAAVTGVGAIRVVGHESKGRINVRLHIAVGP
ncbi:MAG: hypothetical protein Q8O40_03360 [Chloroflexota bacterium]|nr:hypothetical protein [Chloroflexota bacterium]